MSEGASLISDSRLGFSIGLNYTQVATNICYHSAIVCCTITFP